MSKSNRTLTMKLLIDTKEKRVVFAEAGKDVVDFLFSLLVLQVAMIVKLLGKRSMLGSFGNLYGSVEKLDRTYVLPGVEKNQLLRPTVPPSAASTSRSSLLLPAPPSGSEQSKSFFKCGSYNNNGCYFYVTDRSGTRCPNCGHKMTVALEYVPPATEEGSGQNGKKASSMSKGPPGKGFVKGAVTYIVRDDLTVTPMSAISSMTMLNTAAVTDFTALQEKTVRLGYTEGLEIVKASLRSKTVLTDVFLRNKRTHGQH